MNPAYTCALAIVMMAAVPGYAGDVKTYNGAFCQASDGDYEDDFDKLPVSGMSSMYWDEYVTCPVVRDEQATTRGPYQVIAYVYDGSAYDSVTCCFYSNTSYGTLTQSRCGLSAPGFIGYTALGLTTGRGYYEGNYTIQCLLPSGSMVTSYKVDERWDR